MDTNSANKLAKVHPELAARVANTIAALIARGMDVRVVQGLRTYAEQDKLFAQGRSTPGQIVTKARGGESNHNFGLAVDVCPFRDGKPDWDNNAAFQVIGAEGVRHGLAWGGNWKKFIDKPHLELPTGMALSECRSLYQKGGLQAVWNRASQLLDSATVAPPVSDTQSDVLSGFSKQGNQANPGIPAAQSPILKRGSKGSYVVKLQNRLIELGYSLKADGDFGAATESMVKKFQRAKGLSVDGKVGPNTWRALDA